MSDTELDVLLDAFLDGTLTDAQRERFRELLAGDPSLQAEIDFQADINASLRRLVVPREVPQPAELGAAPPAPVLRLPAPRRTWVRTIAAAAALLAIAATIFVVRFMPQKAPLRQPDEVYQSIVSAGFKPREVCTSEDAFTNWTRYAVGELLVIPADLAGITLLGWDYEPVLQPRTGVLLARVGETPVIVLMDARDKARRLTVPRSSGLRIFRRDVGEAVLYEVTPLDHAALLPHARLAR